MRRGYHCSAAANALSTVTARDPVAPMNTSINENFTDIRPATRALKQISIARLRGGKGHYEGTHHCALLMLDPDCVEMPSALLKDTILQPVDKVVLLLIMKCETTSRCRYALSGPRVCTSPEKNCRPHSCPCTENRIHVPFAII